MVNLLNRPALVLPKAIAFIHNGNCYTIQNRTGQILAKALVTNTNPNILALLSKKSGEEI